MLTNRASANGTQIDYVKKQTCTAKWSITQMDDGVHCIIDVIHRLEIKMDEPSVMYNTGY